MVRRKDGHGHASIETFDWRARALRQALQAAERILPTIQATIHTTRTPEPPPVRSEAESQVTLVPPMPTATSDGDPDGDAAVDSSVRPRVATTERTGKSEEPTATEPAPEAAPWRDRPSIKLRARAISRWRRSSGG